MSMEFNLTPIEPLTIDAGKLWIYTNYHCNLSCPYCLASSSPKASPRLISKDTIYQAIDEAAQAGFSQIFFTGGEPFLRDDIFEIIAYSVQHLPTTVLTNAMLLYGQRLKKLKQVQHPDLSIQVSLDGANSEQHDAFRGSGSWVKTIAGIRALVADKFNISISTTLTSANANFIDEICALHRSFGIPENKHIIRTLARRGFSTSGIEVGFSNLPPEITINIDGAFWHPMTTDEDMLLSSKIFPLSDLLPLIKSNQQKYASPSSQAAAQGFT